MKHYKRTAMKGERRCKYCADHRWVAFTNTADGTLSSPDVFTKPQGFFPCPRCNKDAKFPPLVVAIDETAKGPEEGKEDEQKTA